MGNETAIQILNYLIQRAESLKRKDVNSSEFMLWQETCRTAITHIFPDGSIYDRKFLNISFLPSGRSSMSNRTQQRVAFNQGLDEAKTLFASMVEEINLYGEDTKPVYSANTTIPVTNSDINKVFVIHGRNLILKDALFSFLRSISLQPIEWNQAIAATKKGSPNIVEILEALFSMAQAVIVLLTRDDEAKLRDKFITDHEPKYERELTPQARPNVLFEAGMAMGKNPDHTVLVQIGDLRPWSDIAGKHITHLDNTPAKRKELVIKLENAGCKPDTSGTDWLSCDDFS